MLVPEGRNWLWKTVEASLLHFCHAVVVLGLIFVGVGWGF